MGPDLKTGGVMGPDLKTGGVMGPDLKTGCHISRFENWGAW